MLFVDPMESVLGDDQYEISIGNDLGFDGSMLFIEHGYLRAINMNACSQTISFDTFLDVLFFIAVLGAILSSIAVYRMNKTSS